MKLVFIDKKRIVTDSLTVAETFGKRHDNVLRDIKELECSQKFSLLNFEETPYVHPQNNQTYQKYLITQDGFSFLAFGYTGKEAARFKEMYINEFNRMRDELNKPQFRLPQTFAEALEGYAAQIRITETLDNERKKLTEKIETDRPLVIFAESLQESKDSILIGELAKLLKQNGIDIGGTRLFKLLREEGYLMSKGDQYNMPTQRSMDLKIMEIKAGTRGGSDGTVHITRTPKITSKGQIYFINKFKNLAKAQ
ncbi:Rha family transcriptional regulator [Paenibacillus alba]|uniref:Phage regulatory protein/antirepressor Ant n=1 Tax=Paenibacillus alba TaxID=1197127 RepID=A0ABU6GAD1_9BACL|nr:phage regulatory protein/antirepressor Ant [Paenibacillus alba]MEC0231156.1 phage regulatory protein/antirepressor Ant [Paenibacillus alba]